MAAVGQFRTNPGRSCVQFSGNFPGNFVLTAVSVVYGVDMRVIRNHAAIMSLLSSGGVPETADIPARPATPVDCEKCKHYVQRDPRDGHCYMFAEKPGPYCAQFTKDTSPVTVSKDDQQKAFVEQLKAERLRRKAKNFEKRQPKNDKQ